MGVDLLDNLTRIGIDETSYRRGHRYLTVVVCHDTGGWCGRVLVAVERRSKRSSTNSDPNRRDRLTHVSCDGAEWIHNTIRKHHSNAKICLDAFHVVRWEQDAVDEIRREV